MVLNLAITKFRKKCWFSLDDVNESNAISNIPLQPRKEFVTRAGLVITEIMPDMHGKGGGLKPSRSLPTG